MATDASTLLAQVAARGLYGIAPVNTEAAQDYAKCLGTTGGTAATLMAGVAANGLYGLQRQELKRILLYLLSKGQSSTTAQQLLAVAAANGYYGLSPLDLKRCILAMLRYGSICSGAPQAPTNITINQVTSTSITFTFSQPLHIPPDTITGYTIKYGTSSGVYTNSVSAPAGVFTATISGLTPSTAYFWVVVANNGACPSANSAEASTTTSANISPSVTDWANRVHTNGDPTPSAATQAIVDTFAKALVSAGIDSLIYYDLIFAPGGLITSMTPLHKVFGIDPATITGSPVVDSTGFVNTDQMGTGPHTGINPANVWTGTSMGLVIYQQAQTGTFISSPAQWGGGNGGRYGYFWTTTLASYAAFQLAYSNPFAAHQWGFWLGSRTGANQLDIYAANGSNAWANVGTSAAAAAGAVPASGNISFYDSAVATFPYNFSAGSGLSYLAVTGGMTTAQGQALFNAVQAMRQSFNGGFT